MNGASSPRASEQPAGIDPEIVKLGLVVPEIHSISSKQTGVVARAHLQIGIDIVLTEHRGDGTGVDDR
jgi:hypothetical protein